MNGIDVVFSVNLGRFVSLSRYRLQCVIFDRDPKMLIRNLQIVFCGNGSTIAHFTHL